MCHAFDFVGEVQGFFEPGFRDVILYTHCSYFPRLTPNFPLPAIRLPNCRVAPAQFVADDGEVGVVGVLHQAETAFGDGDLDGKVVG